MSLVYSVTWSELLVSFADVRVHSMGSENTDVSDACGHIYNLLATSRRFT